MTACLVPRLSGVDPKRSLWKAGAKLRKAVGDRCGDEDVLTPLANLAPGCGTDDLGALAACSERAAACRFCEIANAVDGLGIDCDL